MAAFLPAIAADNGYCNNGGEFFPGGYENAYLETGLFVTNIDRTWLRFSLAGVPAGATVTSAVLSLGGYDVQSSANARARIAAVAADNPAAPTSASACMALAVGAQSVDWTMPATAAGVVYNAPDLTAVVQEFIDRPGYVAGAHLLLLLTGGAGSNYAYRRFQSLGGAIKPTLTLQWQAGISVPPATATATMPAPRISLALAPAATATAFMPPPAPRLLTLRFSCRRAIPLVLRLAAVRNAPGVVLRFSCRRAIPGELVLRFSCRRIIPAEMTLHVVAVRAILGHNPIILRLSCRRAIPDAGGQP